MKKIELFECELCRAQYGSESDAKKCEAWHVLPKEIVGSRAIAMRVGNEGDKYPKTINVSMSDGKILTYKR